MLRPCVLLLLPLTVALTAATPLSSATLVADPIVELSCSPLNLARTQKMFVDRGKKNVQVIGMYGAAATTGVAHKHLLTLEPNLNYSFIQCVYLDDEPTTTNTGYNLHFKVTDVSKRKVLSQVEARETGGGRPLGQPVAVKRTTQVEIEYDYTANGDDITGSCLTMMVVSQPAK